MLPSPKPPSTPAVRLIACVEVVTLAPVSKLILAVAVRLKPSIGPFAVELPVRKTFINETVLVVPAINALPPALAVKLTVPPGLAI